MKVLFVCLGNICRSPSAEGVFREISDCVTDSAGTGGWHVGAPPYGPMLEAAARRGYDFSDLRARQFRREDFADFDLIIGMDDANIREKAGSQAVLHMHGQLNRALCAACDHRWDAPQTMLKSDTCPACDKASAIRSI